MKAKAIGLVIVTAFVVAACASQSDHDALQEQVDTLEAILDRHRTASQNWAWIVRTNVNCLQKREYGFSEDVRDRDSVIVDCSIPPVDPPTTPPPNGNW